LKNSQQRADELTRDYRAYAEKLISDTVGRSRSVARETEDLVNSMVSDAESHMSDLRRQQTMLEEYVRRMRAAANDVDMQITNLKPPSLEEAKPVPPRDAEAEEDEVLEAVEVTIEVDDK